MSEVLEKIRSRGYWRVIIRPTTFMERRVAHKGALLSILEKSLVDLNGWGFPHVDSLVEIEKGTDWIGQEIIRDPILELWRFYQSGQLVHYFGIPEDWRADAGERLSSGDEADRVMLDVAGIVLRLTEIYEFAARLCFTEAADKAICLEITVDNIGDHLILLPQIGSQKFSPIPQASSPGMQYAIYLSNTEIVSEAKELSLSPALELFRSFQWEPGIDFVRELQSDLLEKIPAVTQRR